MASGLVRGLPASVGCRSRLLANSVVLVAVYVAVIALIWGIADATMAQPRDFGGFVARPAGRRTWRVAHLSDIHTVGERYGFRDHERPDHRHYGDRTNGRRHR